MMSLNSGPLWRQIPRGRVLTHTPVTLATALAIILMMIEALVADQPKLILNSEMVLVVARAVRVLPLAQLKHILSIEITPAVALVIILVLHKITIHHLINIIPVTGTENPRHPLMKIHKVGMDMVMTMVMMERTMIGTPAVAWGAEGTLQVIASLVMIPTTTLISLKREWHYLMTNF